MIIDGKALAQLNKQAIKNQADRFEQLCGRKIGLAVIIVGDRQDSKTYVNSKIKACEQCNIKSFHYPLVADIDQAELEMVIKALNSNDEIDGILVQMPLPKHINETRIINTIAREKDVDGFRQDSPFIPCTPKGIMYMLQTVSTLEGKTALVIGRSNIVGKPIYNLLLNANCTVMQAHSKTPKDILCRMFSFADIVVSAAGKVDLITEIDAEQYWKDNRHDFYGDFSNKKDRIIIDVGINRNAEGKLCGDLSEEFKNKFSEYYTPVPGGVGPMTVTMLLDNVVESAFRRMENC